MDTLQLDLRKGRLDTLLLRRARFLAIASSYIRFADPEVARLCIANFSSDGVGVTYEDAAAVTSFADIFRNNLLITSFEELKFFPNIAGGNFRLGGCWNLGGILELKQARAANAVIINNFEGMGTGVGTGIIDGNAIGVSDHIDSLGIRYLWIKGDVLDYYRLISAWSPYCPLKAIRIDGDLLSSGIGDCISVDFFEFNGTAINKTIPSEWYSRKRGAIVHFGYNGIVGDGSKFDNVDNRISKIYVGDGSSVASDEAVLAQYLADPDWSNFSDILDIWSNYHGEYKNCWGRTPRFDLPAGLTQVEYLHVQNQLLEIQFTNTDDTNIEVIAASRVAGPSALICCKAYGAPGYVVGPHSYGYWTFTSVADLDNTNCCTPSYISFSHYGSTTALRVSEQERSATAGAFDNTCYLFGIPNSADQRFDGYVQRITAYQSFRSNGNQGRICDFIPCRDDNGAGYLYDMVNQVLHSGLSVADGGTPFTPGPDVQ